MARKRKGKMEKVMHEYKHGQLHSGSKSGPKVKSRKQAIAIGMSEARKAGEGNPRQTRGAVMGGKRPGGRDSVKKREARLEGKPL